jgi:hypothetical protein
VIRPIFSEYLARAATAHWFTYRVPSARCLLRASEFVCPSSSRGRWLAAHVCRQDGQTSEAFDHLLAYYETAPRRAEWARRGRLLLRLCPIARGSLTKRVAPYVASLTHGWSVVREPPRQVVWMLGSAEESRLNRAFATAVSGEWRAAPRRAAWHETAAIAAIDDATLPPTPQSPDVVAAAVKPCRSGEPWHVITEDHEISWSVGKGELQDGVTVWQAYVQLVAKGRAINAIAQAAGTPWTHMIDVGAYWLLKVAANEYPRTWGLVLDEFESFLRETVIMGHDLGLHIHTEKSPLALRHLDGSSAVFHLDAERWADLPAVRSDGGSVDRGRIIQAGKRWLQDAVSALDPGFTVMAFRPGAYHMGSSLSDTGASYAVVEAAGIRVFSEALEMDGITESVSRASNPVYRFRPPVAWNADPTGRLLQVLPARLPSMPVYSVLSAARQTAHGRNVLSEVRAYARTNGVILSLDHEINVGEARYGGKWDELDLRRGDWPLLRQYLEAVGSCEELAPARLRDVVTEVPVVSSADDVPDEA